MQRRLEDVDLSSTDISDRLITLACGHIFTVETLDGHCGMQDYYDVDQLGRFLSIKSPPVNYQTPPTCPTCRGPITALRYGRVTKRATLDILEQNVASTMSIALDGCSPSISEYASNISNYQEQAKKLAAEPTQEDESTKRENISFTGDSLLPASAFDLEGMQKVHGIALEEARAWYQVVRDLVTSYRRVEKVAATRGAHVKAYEAALATLFRLEMQAIAQDPDRATDKPEPTALVIVDRKIGQPPPKADVRFQIEAYFLSLELRSLLAEIARSRIEGLSVTSNDPDVMRHRQLWILFVSFLYDSCIADAEKAVTIAMNSAASRQAARAAVHKLRFAFEAFRWNILCERSALFRAGSLDKAERERLCRKVTNYKRLLPQSSNFIEQTYIRARPSQTVEDLKKERQWANENCRMKVEAWERECTKLEEFVEKGGFYQPMSTQEREEIVKAFGFCECSPLGLYSWWRLTRMIAHRGHFYNCENGHTFVITEVRSELSVLHSRHSKARVLQCGGAVEASRCPECNAPIGGSGHRLDSSNTRATEFEAIARRQGSLNGAFPWTRDA